MGTSTWLDARLPLSTPGSTTIPPPLLELKHERYLTAAALCRSLEHGADARARRSDRGFDRRIQSGRQLYCHAGRHHQQLSVAFPRRRCDAQSGRRSTYNLTSTSYDGSAVVGRYSGETASITLRNGNMVSNDAMLGQLAGSSGTVTIATGATWTVNGSLYVGGSYDGARVAAMERSTFKTAATP